MSIKTKTIINDTITAIGEMALACATILLVSATPLEPGWTITVVTEGGELRIDDTEPYSHTLA